VLVALIERAPAPERQHGDKRRGDPADDRKANEPVQYKPCGSPHCA